MDFNSNMADEFGDLFRTHREQEKRQQFPQELTFKQYLELVKSDPKIAQISTARFLEIIESAGIIDLPEKDWIEVDGITVKRKYPFFAEELFGDGAMIAHHLMVAQLRAGSSGLPTGKQLFVLVGPPCTGKSETANLLKKSLAEYDTRPVYKIKGCRIKCEPLWLIPTPMRPRLEEILKIKIKKNARPCYECMQMIRKSHINKQGSIDYEQVPIELFGFSLIERIGIGVLDPSDEKTEDVVQLLANPNLSIKAQKGESHPDAYPLTGIVAQANRGLVEVREIFQHGKSILRAFMFVCEESELSIPATGLPSVNLDTVVLAHTNLSELKRFAADKEFAGLRDRIIAIPFPYNTIVREEVKIYRKLIESDNQFSELRNIHIAPGALEMVAIFAIMTRLVESKLGVTLMQKVKLYNGDTILTPAPDTEKAAVDLRSLKREAWAAYKADIAKCEGMFGISPRDILVAISDALAKEKNGCLTPLKVLHSVPGMLKSRLNYSAEDVEKFKRLLFAEEGDSVMVEHKRWVITILRKAFLDSYGDLAKGTFNRYLYEVALSLAQRNPNVRRKFDLKRDELTGQIKEPDENFMRSIEKHLAIPKNGLNTFRSELLIGININDPDLDMADFPQLREAIEAKLIEDCGSILDSILDVDKPKGEETKSKSADLKSALYDKGFCPFCTDELLRKARDYRKK